MFAVCSISSIGVHAARKPLSKLGETGDSSQSAVRLNVALSASLGGQAMVSFIALTPPVLAVAAAPDLNIRTSDVGLFTTLLFLVAMLSATSGGQIVARLGAIRVSQICLLACSLGLALTATANVLLASLGALLVGLGYGPMTPASSHLLSPVTTRRNRPFVFSLKQTSIPVGGALAGTFAPLLASTLGWRGAVLIIGGAGLAAALALEALRRDYDADRDLLAPLRFRLIEPVRTALGRPRLREICVVSFSYSLMQICFSVFFVTFLVERAGLPLIQAGIALTVAQAAGVAGRIGWGAAAERLTTTRRLLAVLGVVMAACAIASAMVSPAWPNAALVILGAIFGATAVGWNGLYLAEIVRVTSERESASATGAALFFTFGGMMIAPAAFSGIVAGLGSYGAAFGLLALAVLPASLAMFRTEQRP